ncbi:hypothetical protein DFH09DRAFT_1327955 [Mycena vulgaris]|nr:hypothetical protein DFH09DRAFT_1327955 [Mycena vulgaris]
MVAPAPTPTPTCMPPPTPATMRWCCWLMLPLAILAAALLLITHTSPAALCLLVRIPAHPVLPPPSPLLPRVSAHALFRHLCSRISLLLLLHRRPASSPCRIRLHLLPHGTCTKKQVTVLLAQTRPLLQLKRSSSRILRTWLFSR